MGVPMMVDSDWLAAVDAFVRANAEGVPAPVNAADSRFYDVRPILIRSDWVQTGDTASPWRADAAFIVNDKADMSFIFPVYAYGYKPNASTTGYAVWRGRWEFLGAPNIRASIKYSPFLTDLGSPTRTSVLKGLNVQKTTVAAPFAVVEKSAAKQIELYSLHTTVGNGIPYVASVELVDGKLKVDKQYLYVHVTGAVSFFAFDEKTTPLLTPIEVVSNVSSTGTESAITDYPNVKNSNAVSEFNFI